MKNPEALWRCRGERATTNNRK